MARTPGGFTLIEGVFSMFLIFLVLGALVYTLQQAGDVKSNVRNMGELSEVVHTMTLIRADINSNLSISTPAAGGSAASLSLVRMDPDLYVLDRIGPGEDDDPFGADERSVVDYFLDNGVLRKRVKNSAGTVTVEPLISCERLEVMYQKEPAEIEITLEVKNSRRNREHTMKVALR